MNKKGQIENIIWLFIILFVILFLGIMLALGNVVINWVADVAVPELSTLGMVGSANMTDIADSTIVPANIFVQSLSWMMGVIYVMALIGCIGIAFAFRITGNKWLAGFFFVCMISLVIASIFISNIYEDFYDDTGDVADRLKEQALLSWLILYSPLVMSVIGFVCGIIMFTGEEADQI